MKSRLLSMLVLAMFAAPAAAQTFVGGEPAAMGAFGATVAVVGSEVLIGEPGNTTRPGQIYIYRKGASGWAEAAKLEARGAEISDGFGAALAVDANRLLVGTISRGAQLFTRGTDGRWSTTARLTADVGEEVRFGSSVALAGDWAAVGAPGGNELPGAVYLFRRSGDTWSQAAMLRAPTPAPADGFGMSIALNNGRLFVGAPGAAQRAGKVFQYAIDASGQWQPGGEVAVQGIEANDRFGMRVAFDGMRLLVAAPYENGNVGTIYVLRQSAPDQPWQAAGRLFPYVAGGRQDLFGMTMAMQGEDLLVASPAAMGGGAVYAFSQNGEVVQRLTVEDGGQFGSAVALDGDIAAVGMAGADYGAGAAAIYERQNGVWTLASTVESPPEALASVTGGKIECEGEGTAAHFDCKNVDLLSFLPVSEIGGGRGVRLNDVWGWTDPETNREYAIVGRIDGTSFVDITDPENPRYLGDLPKTEGTPAATWRDMKVYENHVFIVADGAQQHGVQVFDLTRLRNVREPQTFTEDAHYDGVASSHNIVINEETGFAYAVGNRMGGETCGGGLHMIDVRDPKNPTFAGCFADPQTGRASTGYSHDAQCIVYNGPDADHRGREICFGSNETMLSIADVTDKQNPVALARASYPNVGYSHQGWVTEDHRYFYMDDELDEIQGSVNATRTLIWDISDLDDPQLVGEFMGATQASDHNLYILGNTMYQSNYQAGLRVVDISDRDNPVEVGYFDTVPHGTNTPGFGGSWSNYPYFPSGTIIVTSGSEGLFVLKKRPTRPVS